MILFILSISCVNVASNYDIEMEEKKDTIRFCSVCKTTKTPMWRGGPAGPKVSSSTIELLHL